MAKRDRRLQVFVSSTYKDLVVERQAAVSAILKAGHIPAGMELFTAGDLSQMETIKEWIDESDVYVLLLGGRYGSVETTTRLSYTELEYDYAASIDKPIFSIVQTDTSLEQKIKSAGSEVMEKDHPSELKLFKEKVLSKISSFFSDEKDIRLAIYESLPGFEKDERVVGWIRANTIPDQTAINAELSTLREENAAVRAELSKLTSQRDAKNTKQTDDWKEIVKTLLDIKITVPAGLPGVDKDVESNAFDLASSWPTPRPRRQLPRGSRPPFAAPSPCRNPPLIPAPSARRMIGPIQRETTHD